LEFLAVSGKSSSTLNTAYSALKFYFESVMKRGFFVSLPRSKNKSVCQGSSQSEVMKMLDVIKNPKHIVFLVLCMVVVCE
jgi:hypothetical protein